MALKDLIAISDNRLQKQGISEERIKKIIPVLR